MSEYSIRLPSMRKPSMLRRLLVSGGLGVILALPAGFVAPSVTSADGIQGSGLVVADGIQGSGLVTDGIQGTG
jgi:hypothetical protein